MLDEVDAVDSMRNADERLGRREAELLAALPVAQERAAKEKEANRVAGIKAEIKRLEKIETERKRAYAKFLVALEAVESAFVSYQAIEKPPTLDSLNSGVALQRALAVDIRRVAPTFNRAKPVLLNGPIEKTEPGTDAYFARCVEVEVRGLREEPDRGELD
ncbi:MAG: hypothetical protein KDB80_03665 [Planctomycetes bacterium]|nr:hypothetical protein [Planctomycetota bacterium]